MPDDIDPAELHAKNESGEIVGVHADIEVSAEAIPALGVAMAKTGRDCPVAAGEHRHLLVPSAVIVDRAVDKEQRWAAPLLAVGERVSAYIEIGDALRRRAPSNVSSRQARRRRWQSALRRLASV